MGQTIYASFVDAKLAEQAAGALLDKGAKAEQLTVVAQHPEATRAGEHADPEKPEHVAESGITTTTPGDAGAGAAAGAGIGAGVGILAGLAALLVPGFGLVLGGGALATAIGGALGATAAGAVAGGALGYLKDQGIDDEVAQKYATDLEANGAILSLDLPSGDITRADVDEVFAKYNARNVHIQG